MSSAILYVAIVAIWAGVLIPRWLRRDSAASGRNSEDAAVTGVKAEPEAEVAEAPAHRPRLRTDAAGREAPPALLVHREEPVTPRPAPTRAAPPRPASARPASARAVPQAEAPAEIPDGGPRGKEHKKMLSSRRRLLGLLLVLTIAAGALAYSRMAAWWVVVPPTVMLLGYLTLLYEAGRADAERRELARARAMAAAEVAAAKRAAPPVPAAPPRAPDAEVIDIAAPLTVAGHKFYDQHADAKLRAVGD